MRFNVQNWIEQVKAKPDHIRHRYMIGCVTLSMFFVVIIWSLTITENFKKSDTTDTAESVGNILPKSSDFSLDQILSGDGSMNSKPERSGQEFLRQQEESRARLNPDEDGLKPKGDQSADKENTTDPSNIVMPKLPQ
ncbi:MAG: hypothetical protein ACEQSB_03530 [Undibacterium sp.]